MAGRSLQRLQGFTKQDSVRSERTENTWLPTLRSSRAHLKDGLGSVALDIISVYDDLDDTIPHLLTDIVTSNAY